MTESREKNSTALGIARAYTQGWNEHDGAAVTSLFAPNGTYIDPILPEPLSGEGIAMYLAALVAAFPDLHFAIEAIHVDADRVILQWRMHGTNTGPLPGMPDPTGGRCDLPGVDVIDIGPDGITSVVGYIDQKTFFEQLGLQTVIVPKDEQPAAEGTVQRLYRAVATGDVPTMLDLLDDKVEWIDAAGFPYAGTYHGPQAVLEGMFARLASEWDGFTVEPSQFIADGDDVVSMGTYSGTYKATGKSFSARYAHAWTVKDGKVIHYEQVVDSAELNKALS